jgi:hypothetical protein
LIITALEPFLFSQSAQPRLTFWHFWLATVQDVLQADWQEAWHSPQPVAPPDAMQGFWKTLICFILSNNLRIAFPHYYTREVKSLQAFVIF